MKTPTLATCITRQAILKEVGTLDAVDRLHHVAQRAGYHTEHRKIGTIATKLGMTYEEMMVEMGRMLDNN